jgi:organic hydroperoxide reductase OsmC/OhrA
MNKQHRYAATIEWTGNTGPGTTSYRAYERRHDRSRYNPEDLLIASLSACHMLWYLVGLCANAGVVVVSYLDRAQGVMVEGADGGGRFTRVVLHPEVTLAAGSNLKRAEALHREAHAKCFIANSVNFPVEHEPIMRAETVPIALA